jgi:hypothetical protein
MRGSGLVFNDLDVGKLKTSKFIRLWLGIRKNISVWNYC